MGKKKKPSKKIDIVPEMLSAAAKDPSSEPEGFIGKYSKKVELQQKKAVLKEVEEQQQELDSMPKIPLSNDAPKHKGMLARAMEKDIKE